MPWLIALGIVALGAALPGVAQAQPTAGERAIELGKAGIELFKAAKWAECAEKFEAADTLSHSPVLRLYKARCLRGDKRLLRARAELKSVASESLPADAPAPWRQAKTDAQSELTQLEQAMPKVVIAVVGGDGAKLTLDGAAAETLTPIEVEPGLHKVSATKDGRTVEATFDAKEGQPSKVELSFLAQSSAGAVPPIKTEPAPAESGTGAGLVPGGVLLGVGGAAAIAGAVLGGLALGAFGSLGDDGCAYSGESVLCNGAPATDQQQSDVDSANLMADASTGLLISGGVVAVVGVVLMIALPADSAPVVKAGRLSLSW